MYVSTCHSELNSHDSEHDSHTLSTTTSSPRNGLAALLKRVRNGLLVTALRTRLTPRSGGSTFQQHFKSFPSSSLCSSPPPCNRRAASFVRSESASGQLTATPIFKTNSVSVEKIHGGFGSDGPLLPLMLSIASSHNRRSMSRSSTATGASFQTMNTSR
jgi:hypothetical protein